MARHDEKIREVERDTNGGEVKNAKNNENGSKELYKIKVKKDINSGKV